jgi:hypothetical protein
MMHYEQFAEQLGRYRTKGAELNNQEGKLANDNDLVVIFPGLFGLLSVRGALIADVPMQSESSILIMKHKSGDIDFINDGNIVAFQRLVAGYANIDQIKYIQIDCTNSLIETMGVWLIEPRVRHSKFPISNSDGTAWGNGCVIDYNEIIEMLL